MYLWELQRTFLNFHNLNYYSSTLLKLRDITKELLILRILRQFRVILKSNTYFPSSFRGNFGQSDVVYIEKRRFRYNFIIIPNDTRIRVVLQ